MRIVIDMQGAQTESRFRGIGRYTMSFAKAIVRNSGKHEVILALSGLFPETIEPIRAEFKGLLLQENIRVWYAPGPVREREAGNESRREAAELLREAFLDSLNADVLHLTSLFEGFIDDAVTSIGIFDKKTPVSVMLYDLIPLMNPKQYLEPNPPYEEYYRRKIEHLKKSSLYLAISEYSKLEGMQILKEGEFENISTACDHLFQPKQINDDVAAKLRTKFGISKPFVLYTGGGDERKNLVRLIQAYAALPSELKRDHQLVFAGKMPSDVIVQLEKAATIAGVKEEDFITTGYICDEELLSFYNLCDLFVFPSWHEGFGLPALEAMACGAPVIGANTSSLPEVINLQNALFDPMDVDSISKKIADVLTDPILRDSLKAHGLKQATRFSWDLTAKKAIEAWERLKNNSRSLSDCHTRSLTTEQLYSRIAEYVDKENDKYLLALSRCVAQNHSNGIERQLLLDVSELCQHDSGTGVQRVVRAYLKGLLLSPPEGFRVEPVYATPSDSYRYARNFTAQFLGLAPATVEDGYVRWQRGDLFFGLDMQHQVQLSHSEFFKKLRVEGVTVKFLVHDLLPIQFEKLFKDPGVKEQHEKLLRLIATLDGAICVSKATADAFESWAQEYSVKCSPNFQIGWVHNGADIEGSQPTRGMPKDAELTLNALRSRPTFLCVSTIEPRKCQEQILDAFEELWANGFDINLAFVGRPGWNTESLVKRLNQHKESGQRLFWLQGITDEYLERVYAESACLIAASLNEGFGLSLIEAARHHVPIVARDIPVFREIAGDCAHYFTGTTASDLASELGSWLEKFKVKKHSLSSLIPWNTWQQSTEELKEKLVCENYQKKQILVDISELVVRDAKTGIQRVVRNILREWLLNPQPEYRVEPVYGTHPKGYRYARKFTKRFLNEDDSTVTDDIIDFGSGDVFLGIDLAPTVVQENTAFYKELKCSGVKVSFVVYDLLPLMDGYFEKGHADACTRWLDVATNGDEAICISEAVALELGEWLQQNKPERYRQLTVESFYLGADIDKPAHGVGLTLKDSKILEKIQEKQSFLQVSTLAPHKGHAQVLDAFETLWKQGNQINLVIVGKEGWLVEDLVKRLRAHAELNNRLFWLEGISDEYLEKIYAACDCLIAASYGEGFGLPLIEAAQHKLPIIAREIPIFREVAGAHAYFFVGNEPLAIEHAIKSWMVLFEQGSHPRSEEMQWLTWNQSASILWRTVCKKI